MILPEHKIYRSPALLQLADTEERWMRLGLDDPRAVAAMARQWREAAIPPLHQQARFEGLAQTAENAEALAACRTLAEEGEYDGKPGLLLFGPNGTGKTSLAVACLWATLQRIRGQRGVHFWSVPKGLLEIRHSFSQPYAFDAEEPPPSVLDLVPGNYMVLLDDLGKQKLSEWVEEQFFVLIDSLWSEGRRVIITTNYSPDELSGHLDPAVLSRIAGLCAPVEVTGTDHRI